MNLRIAVLPLLALLGCPEPAPLDEPCGDGIVEEDEACDDGVNDGRYGGCEPGCVSRAAFCGDGEVNGDEACDDGVNDGAWGSCAPDCGGESGRCGDGAVNGPEVCDDGVNEGGYGGCRAGCLTWAPRCGDGVVNGPEVCDDGVNDGRCGSCTADCADLARDPFLVAIVVTRFSDPLPDLLDGADPYLIVYDGNLRAVYQSPPKSDVDAPVTFRIDGLKVDGATWTVEVWDDDSLLTGDADPLGTLSLDTTVMAGASQRGGARIEWTIEDLPCE